MNNTPRFSNSEIEYLDRMWGVYSGCCNLERGICRVNACWARGLVKRSPANYPNGFDVPTYYPQAIDSPKHSKQPLKIGVGWVGDIIGYGLPFRENIFETIKATPWHKYLFLTKNPEKLPVWEPFPDNCWVGVSVTANGDAPGAYYGLSQIQAKVRFISFEPLQGSIGHDELRQLAGVSNWWVIGAQTQPFRPPEWEWVKEIIGYGADKHIPFFLKENLQKVVPITPQTTDKLIQDYPR